MMLSANVSAAEVGYTESTESIAIIDMSNSNMVRGIFDDYHVYANKWWIMKNGVGVGAAGWTDIDNKSDGSNRYHYSNIRVYSGSTPDALIYESGRKWGYGRVQVSTGDLGKGAMYSNSIFYGW